MGRDRPAAWDRPAPAKPSDQRSERAERPEPPKPPEPTPQERAERDRAERARRADHAEWGVRRFGTDTVVTRPGDMPVTANEAMDRWIGGPPDQQRAADNQRYVRERLATGDKTLGPVRDDRYGAPVTEIYRRCHEGGGHYLERHDDGRGLDGITQRADRLRDPAHRTDSPAYLRADDAEHPRQHRSGFYTTHIPDPVAFATTVARIHEHPRVKEALAKSSDGRAPSSIEDLSIEEILGPDGHQACRGWKLPGDDKESMKAERVNREEWVSRVRTKLDAGASDWETAHEQVKEDGRRGKHTLHEPTNEPIPTFAGGTFTVAFRAKTDRTGWELKTLYPNPPEAPNQPDHTGDRR